MLSTTHIRTHARSGYTTTGVLHTCPAAPTGSSSSQSLGGCGARAVPTLAKRRRAAAVAGPACRRAASPRQWPRPPERGGRGGQQRNGRLRQGLAALVGSGRSRSTKRAGAPRRPTTFAPLRAPRPTHPTAHRPRTRARPGRQVVAPRDHHKYWPWCALQLRAAINRCLQLAPTGSLPRAKRMTPPRRGGGLAHRNTGAAAARRT